MADLNKTVGIHKWQLQHLNSEKKFHMLVWHRKARKTFTALLKVYKEAINHKGVYWIVSPSFRLAKNTIWDDPRMLDTVFDKEVVDKKNQSELSLKLINGSWIYLYGADNPDYLRGPNPDGVVLDEYSVLKEEIWSEIVAPIVYSNKGWVFFCFTPKGQNHAWKLWLQAKDNPDWERSFLPASKSNILSEKELKSIKSTLPEAAYAQEFECEFLAGEGVVFRRVKEAIKENIKINRLHPHIFGLDLGRKLDYTVLTGFDKTNNHMDFFDRFSVIDWQLQKSRILNTLRRFGNPSVVVEANSIGDPIIEDLQKGGARVIPFVTTSTSKANIIRKLSIFIENKYISYPNTPEMIEELESFGYEMTRNGNTKYGAPEGCHDDIVMSMAFAVKYLSDKPLPISQIPVYQFDWKPKPKQIQLDPYD